MDLKIVTIPSNNPIYAKTLLNGTILLSNGLLESVSDDTLIGTIGHEAGHIKTRWTNFFVYWVLSSFLAFTMVLFYDKPWLLICYIVLWYAVLCAVIRHNEMVADRHCLSMVGEQSTLSMLRDVHIRRKPQFPLLSVFYWHPSAAVRINRLFPGVKNI